MSEIASRARWTLNSTSAKNVVLKKLKTYSESDESSVEHVYNCFEDGPIGVVDKPGGGGLEFEYYAEAGSAEVNWRKLKDAKEWFSLTKQVVGGERVQYTRCRISNVTSDGDDQGSHMQKVSITWSQRKTL